MTTDGDSDGARWLRGDSGARDAGGEEGVRSARARREGHDKGTTERVGVRAPIVGDCCAGVGAVFLTVSDSFELATSRSLLPSVLSIHLRSPLARPCRPTPAAASVYRSPRNLATPLQPPGRIRVSRSLASRLRATLSPLAPPRTRRTPAAMPSRLALTRFAPPHYRALTAREGLSVRTLSTCPFPCNSPPARTRPLASDPRVTPEPLALGRPGALSRACAVFRCACPPAAASRAQLCPPSHLVHIPACGWILSCAQL
ncbi:hypothetical protein DENSPDRAFT_587800 [Dentipellis sp. KUC8613]|nr:hypothetical protein DENSPDRAFT_587800 [Dentipellis sp. KUC8613]